MDDRRRLIGFKDFGDPVYEEARTRCKHGFFDCQRCGTAQRSDGLHKTRGGRGVIGEAIARSKRR